MEADNVSNISTSNSSSSTVTARNLYEKTGNASAALELLTLNESSSSTTPYNEFLCKSMISTSQLSMDWLEELTAKEAIDDVALSSSPSLLSISKWIMAYNRGLCLLMLDRPNETWDLVWPIFESDVLLNDDPASAISNGMEQGKNQTKEMEEFLNVACHMALLLLQAMLEPNFINTAGDNSSIKRTLDWLQNAVTDQVPLLKFLLSMINSRMELSNIISDNTLRTARKDLKQAMEIFQHKLKVTSQQISENNQESSALNLKANTERLKGNVKKALVLLGEAKTNENDNNLEQMHHYNNQALVYHSDGKPSLALHAWSKALSLASTEQQASAVLLSNGTPQTNHQIAVLFNASLTCMQQQNHQAAYECMAVVVKHWNRRADCWLRLAEACIGLQAKQKEEEQSVKFQTVRNKQGDVTGIVLRNHAQKLQDDSEDVALVPVLGSPQDMEQLKSNPLPRAKACLTNCIQLLLKNSNKNSASISMQQQQQKDSLIMLSARLSMSYVCLEHRQFEKSLENAALVLALASALLLLLANNDNEEKEDGPSKQIVESTIQRQIATARMYGAEASCALGDATAGMTILVGDNDQFIDRLASDLAGVTLEEAASNQDGKARLAKAQAMVRCNASIVSAELNHMGTAKQLAMSAQAMEGVYRNNSSSTTRSALTNDTSYAKRALVYCMLREGNSSAVLQILRSGP